VTTPQPIPLTLLFTAVRQAVDAILEQKMGTGFIEKLGEDVIADAVRDGVSMLAAKLTAEGLVVS